MDCLQTVSCLVPYFWIIGTVWKSHPATILRKPDNLLKKKSKKLTQVQALPTNNHSISEQPTSRDHLISRHGEHKASSYTGALDPQC